MVVTHQPIPWLDEHVEVRTPGPIVKALDEIIDPAGRAPWAGGTADPGHGRLPAGARAPTFPPARTSYAPSPIRSMPRRF